MNVYQRPASRGKKTAVACAIACGLAAPFEGLRQRAYADPVGIPTICFGSTKGVRLGDTATEAECREKLTQEMTEYVSEVERCTSPYVVLSNNQLAAFSSAAYNVGTGLVCDPVHSSAARLLREGKASEACYRLLLWDKATIAGQKVTLPGLTKRREAETKLCMTPDYA